MYRQSTSNAIVHSVNAATLLRHYRFGVFSLFYSRMEWFPKIIPMFRINIIDIHDGAVD